jgi:hypothetical protein
MSLARRVERLRGSFLAPEGCEECGSGGDPWGYPDEDVEYEVEYDDEAVDEFCPSCGRQTVHVIVWGDEDEQPRLRASLGEGEP